MIAEFASTTNQVGNGFGIFFIFLYLAFQGTGQDTTMYLWVCNSTTVSKTALMIHNHRWCSEIFPTEIRSIGMGFSLLGQFASTIILLQTAPIGFAEVGWKYFLVIICWCIIFLPSKLLLFERISMPCWSLSYAVIYFYFPETARLTLEEISQKFGDDVAVHITDASQEDRDKLERALEKGDAIENASTRAGPRSIEWARLRRWMYSSGCWPNFSMSAWDVVTGWRRGWKGMVLGVLSDVFVLVLIDDVDPWNPTTFH
jgi:hypothetical protein